MMVKGIIDRLEGDTVVVETEDGMINIPLCKFPQGVKEGDCLRIEGDHIEADPQATAERRAQMEQRLKKLFGE